MEKETKQTELGNLQLCNLVAKGMSVAKAKEIIAGAKKPQQADPEKKAKPTAAERKLEIIAEIEAIGGKLPAKSANLALHEKALAEAKEAEVAKAEALETEDEI